MAEPSLIQRQRTLLHELVRLAAERAGAEAEAESQFVSRNEAAEKSFREAAAKIENSFKAQTTAAETEFQQAQQQITRCFEIDDAAARKEYSDAKRQIDIRSSVDHEKTAKAFQEAHWTNGAVWEAAQTNADKGLREVRTKLEDYGRKREALQEETDRLLKEWRQRPSQSSHGEPQIAGQDKKTENPMHQVHHALVRAEDSLGRLKELRLPGLFKGLRLFGLVAFLATIVAGPAWFLTKSPTNTAIAGAAAAGFGGLIGLVLYVAARSQVRRIYKPVAQSLNEAQLAAQRTEDAATAGYQRQITKAKDQFDREHKQIEGKYPRLLAEIERRHSADIRQADETYPQKLAAIKQQFDGDARSVDEKYRRKKEEAQRRHRTDAAENEARHSQRLQEGQARHASDWQILSDRWRQGMAEVHAELEEINAECARRFPAWDSAVSEQWTPAKELPPVMQFGEFHVGMKDIPHGIPKDERLRLNIPTKFTFPALLSFPSGCSVLFQAADDGRTHAVQALQAVMLRLLTSNPPGKVRFTIIDPVGLGKNFAAFMHLADYDEALVNSRIWTETEHIESRLEDLTAHMENVIQKYLRNQFKTIEEYNAHAGEVAEPFRFLVVANFPANFSVEAARRLLSIAHSGPRCGVHTLILVDSKRLLPADFNLSDLAQNSARFIWKNGRFAWQDADFGRFPLQMDVPPDDEVCTRLLQCVGEKAKESSRVEVPFEFVVAPPGEWWDSDSRSGIKVPLGRAGATKRQFLELGKGTSQHVLIAGKTGSGKSTLLHTLIVNISLLYSPDEIELHLIDFKKGVEFKTYATHLLPHARVIAIESEREFGLSVLQRLDAELKRRGDRFRELGVHDLAACRQAASDQPMPRVLLIVDEFQEFFVEDDKIARDAALLLDRLVRQGRAFGIHILLGSQTLGGAYNPARSTIDQMAVRIALQCSETDAHLILSADNPAARLLSRPGEAIYNDANGLFEGNDLFQVVWLSDRRREDYLRQIHALAGTRSCRLDAPPIVFEGNAPANVENNPWLNQWIESPLWKAGQRLAAARAWLGEAVAIKDPTAAVFRRQSGSNLLAVGQQLEAALGMYSAALVSLATQHSPEPVAAEGQASATPSAQFYVLDGTAADDPLSARFSQLSSFLPHVCRVVGPREAAAALEEVSREVERRQGASQAQPASLYLFIFGLQRFRELRKQEEDFSFSRKEEERPHPSKLLSTILREGASVGVHTLIWCDTLTNLNRGLDRQSLREFEQKVLFQMSGEDSSHLIDTPLAAKLGAHRAIYYSEEQATVEKFRPYGPASDSWLQKVKSHLHDAPVNV